MKWNRQIVSPRFIQTQKGMVIIVENAITVSQLNRYIKAVLSADSNLKGICLKGEISNFTDHKKTGNFYFTLKDNS